MTMKVQDERSVNLAPYRQEAAEARARIGAIIDRIQYRVSPGHLIGEASEAVKDGVAGQVEGMRQTLQKNPMAVGFVGGLIGIAAARRATRSTD